MVTQAFTRKISICSAKINHVLRCSLSGELVTGRACLRTADEGAACVTQLQLTELKEQRVAQRELRSQARKSELKSSPEFAILLDMLKKLHAFRTEGDHQSIMTRISLLEQLQRRLLCNVCEMHLRPLGAREIEIEREIDR